MDVPSGPRSVQKSASSQFVNSVWNALLLSVLAELLVALVPPAPVSERDLVMVLWPEVKAGADLEWPEYRTTHTVGAKHNLWFSPRRLSWDALTSDSPVASNRKSWKYETYRKKSARSLRSIYNAQEM